MLGLQIFCWTYLVFTLLGRLVNYNKNDKESNRVRIIDNIVIFMLVVILYILARGR